MPEEATRPPDGRRGVYRRPKRESVPATGPWDDFWDDDEGDAGSAGVREPRHPNPLGPMADAGELPLPEPQFVVALPDPRR